MLEIKAKRTKYTKTFHTGKNRRMLMCSPYPLHIEKEGKFTEINLKPKETENGYILETPFYKFEFQKFPFKIIFNERWVRSLDSPCKDFISLVDKGIEVKNIFPGTDMLIRILPESVTIFLKLKEGKYELNWKAEYGDVTELHNYDVAMTVRSFEFGKKQILEYPEVPLEGQIEFTKLQISDHFEEFPCKEIYYAF